MRLSIINTLPALISLITISSINQWSELQLGNTFFWWVIYSMTLYLFIKGRKVYFDFSNDKNLTFLYVYLAWNIVCIARGALVAANYWEWKNLASTTLVLLLPLSIHISTNKLIIQKIIAVWVNYVLPVFFIFLFFMQSEAIGRYLTPISFLILFIAALNKKWKLTVIIFTCIVLFADLGARSNVIKFVVPGILSSIYYLRLLLTTKVLNIARFLLLFLPFILFSMGIMGIFNVFKMDEYIGDYKTKENVNGEERESKLTADTRTFLYTEVIESAIKHHYILFGRTPARGNDSAAFGLHQLEELKTGKMERFANEVSILNIFTWTGLVGVILYLLIFLKASFLAINKSNNIYIKIIGLYVAFRWAYAWVEDFSRFDLSYLFLWIMIGMCFSRAFRNMTDSEIKLWARGIFEKRYTLASLKLDEIKRLSKPKQ
jgi:hypothetical protein